MVSILAFIFSIVILVFVHELGHLFAAKCGGIGVLEFSLGMGPKLFVFKLGETVYNFLLILVNLRKFPEIHENIFMTIIFSSNNLFRFICEKT